MRCLRFVKGLHITIAATMNERTQVLIFVILLFTSMFGMAGWVFWDYKQLKKKDAANKREDLQ